MRKNHRQNDGAIVDPSIFTDDLGEKGLVTLPICRPHGGRSRPKSERAGKWVSNQFFEVQGVPRIENSLEHLRRFSTNSKTVLFFLMTQVLSHQPSTPRSV